MSTLRLIYPPQVSGHLRLSFILVSFLIFAAPLMRGGNRSIALLGLEAISLLVILLLIPCFFVRRPPSSADRLVRRSIILILATCPVWLPLVQIGIGSTKTPFATTYSALAGVPIVALFLAGYLASELESRLFLGAWLVACIAQMCYALLQLSGSEFLYFGLQTNERLIGTFASKNSLANFLAMGIAIAAYKALPGRDLSGGVMKVRVSWPYAIILFFLFLTIVLTSSRAGIVISALIATTSILWSTLLLNNRSKPVALFVVGASLLLVATALLITGFEWATRFDANRLVDDFDMRSTLWRGAISLTGYYFPFGSGLGSFPWVSAKIQPPEIGRFWFDLAHNDYLQLIAENGLLGLFLIAITLFLFISRFSIFAVRVRRMSGSQQTTARMGLACGFGLLAFGLHAWVDYPFHIPANAMMAANLLGLMCRPLAAESQGHHIRKPI